MKRLPKAVAYPLDQRRDIRVASDVIEHDHEFVAADPTKNIAMANRAAHPLGNFPEQRIASGMAVNVVDPFEVVEIDESKRQFLAFQLAGDCLFDQFLDIGAVRKVGELVVIGTVPQRLLAGFELFRQVLQTVTLHLGLVGALGGKSVGSEEREFFCQRHMCPVKPRLAIRAQQKHEATPSANPERKVKRGFPSREIEAGHARASSNIGVRNRRDDATGESLFEQFVLRPERADSRRRA